MNASSERVFYYHADANPIGGHLTHPFETVLHSKASVSLSQAGGHAVRRSESFHHDNLIRTGAHYSQAMGAVHKKSGNWTTMVTSVVENLNMLDVVTADRIVSRIALENKREKDSYYPKVSFIGCQFENLRIGGRVVTPAVDLDLLSGPAVRTKVESSSKKVIVPAKAAASQVEFPDVPWPEEPGFLKRAIEQSKEMTTERGAPAWLSSRFDWIPSAQKRAKRGYVLASLVNGVHDAAPGSSFGHVVHVPGFGNVFLGELIVTSSSFNLTMLRAEMGCVADGNVGVASARGGTFPMP